MNKPDNFIAVWGVPDQTPLTISDALRSLNVSHTIIVKKGPARPFHVRLGFKQPRRVVVTEHTGSIQNNAVNFVVASYAELAETNYQLLPNAENSLVEAVKGALVNSTSAPKVNVLSALDYVGRISKPSLLNSIQALIYKIQPYSLRKETNAAVLNHLAGKISERTIMQLVKRHMKTEALAPLLIQARPLRSAVLMLGGDLSVDEISERTGVAVFDLNYLSKTRK